MNLKRKLFLLLVAAVAGAWLTFNMPLAKFGIRLNTHLNDLLWISMPAHPASGKVELVGLTEAKFRSFGTYADLESIVRTIMEQKPLFAICALMLPTSNVPESDLRAFVKFAAAYPNLYFFSDLEESEPNSLFVHPVLKNLRNVFIPISADRGPSQDNRMRSLILEMESRPNALLDLLGQYGIERKISDFKTFDVADSKQAYLRYRREDTVKMTPYREVREGRHSLQNKIVVFGHIFGNEDTTYRVLSPYSLFGEDLAHGLSASQRLGINLETILQKDSIAFVADGVRATLLLFLMVFYFAGVLFLSPERAFLWGFLTIGVWAGCLVIGYTVFSQFLFIGQFLIVISIVHFVVSSIQLTRYLRARDHLLAARERAVELQEMQARLVVKSARADSGLRIATQVAHDIRSPLSAISIVAQRARSQMDGELHEVLTASAKRLQKIADDLLRQFRNDDFADTGGVFNIMEMLEQLAESYRLTWPRVKITVAGDPGLRLFVVDTVGLERALSNLINNSLEALEAAKTDAPQVTLSLSKADAAVEIHIEDNGPGVSPALAAEIFDRGKSFGKEGGSGLGLHQAREVAKHAGGSLALIPSGVGAHFVFTLPLSRAPQGELEIYRRVAVVEDNAEVRERWVQKLKAAGAEVTAFAAPEEFERTSHAEPFTLLTDLMFDNSEETGFHLLNRLQNLNCQKILCSSLGANIEVQAMALRLADLAIVKTAFENMQLKIRD